MWVIDLHLSLELVQYNSSISIEFPNISNPSFLRVVLRIHAKVYLYSVCFAEDKKTKFILNLFLWSICHDFYAFIQAFLTNRVPLLEHVRLVEVSLVW